MIKSFYSLIFICFLLSTSLAQIPLIQWQRSLGGSANETTQSARYTSDGGAILTGYTRSNDGDVSGLNGTQDIWVVKLDNVGGIQWQRCLGGSQNEAAYSVQQTADSGYILAGWTQSIDGDVIGNHGATDFWIVKLNSTGSIQWQRCLGGSDYEDAASIQLTPDGGYIVTGQTTSNNGDVSGNHGAADFWVVKLNSTGGIQWQRCMGGSQNDIPKSVQPTDDGGYVVAGFTISNDGDVIGKHGMSDFWVFKLDNLGNTVWRRCLGGSSFDNASCIQPTPDGGYIVSGSTQSNDGDVSGNHGSSDMWVVKLNDEGQIQWQRCLGGSNYDGDLSYIEKTSDGGYIASTATTSNNGDVSGFRGGSDVWVVKLNNSGAIQWQRCSGGSAADGSQTYIQPTADGGYFFSAVTYSNNGDVSGNHGGGDMWAVKLTKVTDPICTSVKSGNWTEPSTWSCGREPTLTDIVVIAPNHTVTISTSTARAKGLKYDGGQLFFSTQQANLSF